MEKTHDSPDPLAPESVVNSVTYRLRAMLARASSEEREAARVVGIEAARKAATDDPATVRAATMRAHMGNVAKFAMESFLLGHAKRARANEVSEGETISGRRGERRRLAGSVLASTTGEGTFGRGRQGEIHARPLSDADDDPDDDSLAGRVAEARIARREAEAKAIREEEEARKARREAEGLEVRTWLALRVEEPDASILRRWDEPLAHVAKSLRMTLDAVKSRRKRLGPEMAAVGFLPPASEIAADDTLSEVDTSKRVFDPV